MNNLDNLKLIVCDDNNDATQNLVSYFNMQRNIDVTGVFYDGEYCLGGGTIDEVYMDDVKRRY